MGPAFPEATGSENKIVSLTKKLVITPAAPSEFTFRYKISAYPITIPRISGSSACPELVRTLRINDSGTFRIEIYN
jgi:hypothetical protein